MCLTSALPQHSGHLPLSIAFVIPLSFKDIEINRRVTLRQMICYAYCVLHTSGGKAKHDNFATFIVTTHILVGRPKR